VSAYVDIVAIDGTSADVAHADATETAMRAVVEKEDPTASVLVTGLALGPERLARRSWMVGQFTHLGAKPMSVAFSGSAAAIQETLAAAATLKDMLSGEVVTLDEQAAALRLTLEGRDAEVDFRTEGDRPWVWLVGISAMLFGLAGVIFADDLLYPSSIGALWGIGVLFVGLVYIIVGEVTTRGRERTT
jgi:hypothetical protein